MDIAFRPVHELMRLMADGELTSEALLESLIERLDRFNPDLNAVVYTDLDRARERARAADAARARGETWGPLHGLPMTIKETYEVEGMPTTAGAPEWRDHRSTMNAVVAQRLLDAGAVLFGKTNVPLYAGDLQSYNEIYGTTNNPWDTARTPGGSSGGAAAALAAGITPLEYGSDIGGSIRTPSSFCGVCGHKPSYGIVPGRGHVPGPPGSLTDADIGVMGPLARSVDDLETALDITAGPDRDDAPAWRLELPPARGGSLKDFRVAAWLDDAACPVDQSVLSVLERTVVAIEGEGVAVDRAARPEGIELDRSHDTFYDLLTAAMSAGLPGKVFDNMIETAGNADPGDRDYGVRFARGATQRHAQWLRTNERRLHMRRAWADFFERFDVLLCPVTFVPAFEHDQSNPVYERRLTVNGEVRPYMDVVTWVGLTGVVYLPVTVVPVGRTNEGLPVGIQIAGPYLGDRTTLQFARGLESLLGGFSAPPGY
ncbi:amidase [Ectothiorhodospiraceae bacterium WFHF3C12]|nr:amidase [Ectothiorhodospiraceae bacterium WFHF3C12]